MSPRAIIATAVAMTLAGPTARSIAQMPPEAAALGGDFRTAQAQSPYYAAQPNFMPGPATAAPPGGAMMPGGPPPGYYSGPPLPSDVVGAGPGICAARRPMSAPNTCCSGSRTPRCRSRSPRSARPAATPRRPPGTQLLYGNGDINFNSMSGVRAVAGVWLTNNESFGLEGNFFILPKKTGGSPPLQGTDLLPTLGRPFFDTASNIPNSLVVNQPGTFQGAITTTGSLQLWGGTRPRLAGHRSRPLDSRHRRRLQVPQPR